MTLTLQDAIDDIRDALLEKQRAVTQCTPTEMQRAAAMTQARRTIKIISNLYMSFNGAPPGTAEEQQSLERQIIGLVERCSYSRVVDLAELKREMKSLVAETAKVDVRDRCVVPQKAMDAAKNSNKSIDALAFFAEPAPGHQIHTTPQPSHGRAAMTPQGIGDFFSNER